MRSLNEVVKDVWMDCTIKPGDFLDQIRFEHKQDLLPADWFDEPLSENISFTEWWRASWIVACFHQLCLEFDMRVPHWILNRKWVLDKPYWANDTTNDNLRVILLCESPYPFRSRNIYVDKNVMKRV